MKDVAVHFTVFCLVSLLFLSACAGAKVVRLRDPVSGDIVKCSGPGTLPEVTEVNRCIYDYEQMGYKVWR